MSNYFIALTLNWFISGSLTKYIYMFNWFAILIIFNQFVVLLFVTHLNVYMLGDLMTF
jgi:hypothetical protein